jgi:PAS domain S-box-containing protein
MLAGHGIRAVAASRLGLAARLGGIALVPAAFSVGAVVVTAARPSLWVWGLCAVLAAGVTGSVAIAREIRHERYRTLLDRVPVGLYRTTPDGSLKEVNPALAQIFGFEDPAAMLAAPAQDFYVDPSDRKRWMDHVNASAGWAERELRMRRSDGVEIWVRDRVIPVRGRDGSILFYEGELEDVTEARRNREALQAALKSKIQLIGAVSHELRTPLTTVVGFVKLLRENPDLSSREQREMLTTVEQQTDDIVAIVEDLLTAAQAESGSLVVSNQPFDLAAEVSRAIVGLERRHEGRLDASLNRAVVFADPTRVRQIVRNLVSNAIGHGGPNISVGIERTSDQVTVRVTDDGPGLASGDDKRVFEAFQRGRSGGRTGSVGLGLTISRHLAREMGGDLTYRRDGGDTCFELTLPAAPGAQPRSSGSAPATTSGRD